MPDTRQIQASELAEQLKDMAHDRGLHSLTGVMHTGPDEWTTVRVQHAALISDSKDGWDVYIENGGL